MQPDWSLPLATWSLLVATAEQVRLKSGTFRQEIPKILRDKGGIRGLISQKEGTHGGAKGQIEVW